jgi:hypothetical protein
MNWLSLIGTGVTLILAGANAAFFIVIKFNDLRHLEKSVAELILTLKESVKKQNDNAERLAKIEGKCLANHGN